MKKPNAGIMQFVENEIQRRILKGELYTPEMVNADILANHDMWAMIMTIAINRALGVGKKRFEERVQPVINELLADYFRHIEEDNGDRIHAISIIERMYNQIMEDTPHGN